VNETTDRGKNEFIAQTHQGASKDSSYAAGVPESSTVSDSGKNGDTRNKDHGAYIKIPADSGNFSKLSDWLSGILRGYQCPEEISNQIMLVNEEIFINIASYAYPITSGVVTARIGKKENMIALQYEDDGIPFNPLEMPTPEINIPLEERKIGGLGIILVRKMMDKVKYKCVNNKNKLILLNIIS
jgi:anti-sigma regulatory factor (Ser/Thr protein kinase)